MATSSRPLSMKTLRHNVFVRASATVLVVLVFGGLVYAVANVFSVLETESGTRVGSTAIVTDTTRNTVLAVLGSMVVLLTSSVGVWWALSHNAKRAEIDPVVEHDIHMFAEPIKTKETYSELPEVKRDDFLKKEAARLGLDPTKEATPELMTMHCIDTYRSKLYKTASQYGDDVHLYQTALNHAQIEIQDRCYADYDPDGKILPKEMPHMQQH